jgi:methylated-DNA-[protein]-cysteine S-methyltransferase
MIFWTTVSGKLAGGERFRVYAAAANGRIVQLGMDAEGHPCSEDEFLWRLSREGAIQRWHGGTGSGLLDAAIAQVEDYMAGRQVEFDLPLQFRGTPFQTAVWQALTRIPFGETRSYGEIGEVIGKPAAMRAVGQANGRNRLPLVVPCHRVIAAGGKLGGFGGGIALKATLLAHEQAVVKRRKLRAAHGS